MSGRPCLTPCAAALTRRAGFILLSFLFLLAEGFHASRTLAPGGLGQHAPDPDVGSRVELSETLAMASLMLDIAFAPPISLQIRSIREEGGEFLRITGETVFLSYFIPF